MGADDDHSKREALESRETREPGHRNLALVPEMGPILVDLPPPASSGVPSHIRPRVQPPVSRRAVMVLVAAILAIGVLIVWQSMASTPVRAASSPPPSAAQSP